VATELIPIHVRRALMLIRSVETITVRSSFALPGTADLVIAACRSVRDIHAGAVGAACLTGWTTLVRISDTGSA
jgi:hypothetical protein